MFDFLAKVSAFNNSRLKICEGFCGGIIENISLVKASTVKFFCHCIQNTIKKHNTLSLLELGIDLFYIPLCCFVCLVIVYSLFEGNGSLIFT